MENLSVLEMHLKKMAIFETFKSKIQDAINDNSIEDVKNLLFSDNYKDFTKEQKEKVIFIAVNISFKYWSRSEDILKYLIFEYGIDEKYYLENTVDQLPATNQMFLARKLDTELRNGLDSHNTYNKNKPIKSLKV